jgi:hypothetical protein
MREQPVGGFARLTGSPDDGAIVLAQDFEPGPDVIRVSDGRDDAERGAAECGVQLGTLSEQSSCLSGLSSAETSRSGGVARF